MVRAGSLAAAGEEAAFTSLSRKIQQLSPMKWGKHKERPFLLAPACLCNLLTVLAWGSAHVSGDTRWDAFVFPVDEPAQEFFSCQAAFVVREVSGVAREQLGL